MNQNEAERYVLKCLEFLKYFGIKAPPPVHLSIHPCPISHLQPELQQHHIHVCVLNPSHKQNPPSPLKAEEAREERERERRLELLSFRVNFSALSPPLCPAHSVVIPCMHARKTTSEELASPAPEPKRFSLGSSSGVRHVPLPPYPWVLLHPLLAHVLP